MIADLDQTNEKIVNDKRTELYLNIKRFINDPINKVKKKS